MRKRLDKKQIYPKRVHAVSKTEAEKFMGQMLPPETVKILEKKLADWKKEHSWTCKCGKVNEEFVYKCACCGLEKNIK